jgi:leucyl-tRNA synthetase
VRARSSDEECVVAQLDQWYLDYGEPSWRGLVEAHLRSPHFKTYDSQMEAQFDAAVKWLGQWACSRWFGLGTKVPWDKQFVIESLSDSTVYMAYYAVVHKLQGGALDGSVVGSAGIKPEQLTDDVRRVARVGLSWD